MGYYLGVDVGTTFTAAAAWRDGRVDLAGLGNHGPVVPSVLFRGHDGTMLVGDAAVRRAAREPARVAREFKRRVGDPTPMIVGGVPYSADALMATMLRWVVDRVTEAEGGPPDAVVVAHPASWGPYKLDLLRQAVGHAGLAGVDTVSEPEAAAIYYATRERVAAGVGPPVALDAHPEHGVALGAAIVAAERLDDSVGELAGAEPASATATATARTLDLGANWPRPGSPPPEPPFVLGPDGRAAGPATHPRRQAPCRRAGWSDRVRRGRDWVRTAVAVALAAGAVAVQVRNMGEDGEPERRTDVPPLVRDGGAIVDAASFVGAQHQTFDPTQATVPGDVQVTSALFDGLTASVEASDASGVVQPAVARTWLVSDDGLVWTFIVRDGLRFADGSRVVPSAFVRGWERATDPALASPNVGLFGRIAGATGKRSGDAEHLEVVGDDTAMTLTVGLTEPFADFEALVSHPAFSPLPPSVDEVDEVVAAGDRPAWGLHPEDMEAVGNGPFVAERTAGVSHAVDLVPNERWDGRRYDDDLHLPRQPFLDRITFRGLDGVTTYDESADALDEGDAQVVAVDQSGETEVAGGAHAFRPRERPLLHSYFLTFKPDDPVVGGEGNAHLRRAIRLALDSSRTGSGSWTAAQGLTPSSAPGHAEDACTTCYHDTEAARAEFAAWRAAGNELREPLVIEHSDQADAPQIVLRIVEDLKAVGIDAVHTPHSSAEYRERLGGNLCQVCWAGRAADYPAYGSILDALFAPADGVETAYTAMATPEVRALLGQAHLERDADERARLYRQAEGLLLDESAAVVPVLWGLNDRLYDGDALRQFDQGPTGVVSWETVGLER